MGEYYIGTSGFSYADWRGAFYPETLPKEDFLAYYAGRFPFVELNFSYYRQPSVRTTAGLVEKGGEGFLFTIKGHASMTHERDDSWKRNTEIFLEGIRPLEEGEALAGVLLQFPYSFHYTAENRRYLAELTEELQRGGVKDSRAPLLVEFRNNEWEGETVDEELVKRNISRVVSDTPKLEKLPSTEARVTAETAYLRLHGRNRENWWSGDNTSRYDYLYSRDELESFLPLIEQLMGKSSRLFIAFNNHHKGQAVENAAMLGDLIEGREEKRDAE